MRRCAVAEGVSKVRATATLVKNGRLFVGRAWTGMRARIDRPRAAHRPLIRGAGARTGRGGADGLGSVGGRPAAGEGRRHMTTTTALLMASFLPAFVALGLGNTLGYHRLFTHRAFTARPALRAALALLGALHAGPPLLWIGLHRHHHLESDGPGDPHSPVNGGLLQAHAGWLLERAFGRRLGALPILLFAASGFGQQALTLLHDIRRLQGRNPPVWLELCKDLREDRVLMALERPLLTVSLFTLQLSALWWLAGPAGLLWLWALHLCLTNSSWAVNSICHGAAFGRAPYDTGEGSRDVPWLAPFTLGEAYHNAHHRYPRSACHGLHGGFDPTWWCLRALRRAGLATTLWLPKEAKGPAAGAGGGGGG